MTFLTIILKINFVCLSPTCKFHEKLDSFANTRYLFYYIISYILIMWPAVLLFYIQIIITVSIDMNIQYYCSLLLVLYYILFSRLVLKPLWVALGSLKQNTYFCLKSLTFKSAEPSVGTRWALSSNQITRSWDILK